MSSCSTSWLTRLAWWLFGTTFLLGSVLSGVQPPEVYVSSNAPTHDFPSKSQRLELVSVKYEHVEVPLEITLWIMLASIAKIGFHVAPGMSRLLPESCLLLIMGLAVGGLIWLAGQKAPLVMNSEVFFLYLLPPIVMDASYFLPARPFIANIASILCFAIIGTLWNTFGIAFSLYAICQVEAVDLPDLPLLHLLLFGSLASAVDPVAVLSVFEEIGVDEQLYILVFGESMLNDAVTLVLYQLLTAMCEMEASGETIGGMDVALGVARFVVVGVGGIATGLICGFAGAFSSRFTKGLRVLEPLCIFTFSYLSYLLAEMLQLSTIMAVFSCTMGMKQYVEANISTKSRMTVKYFLKMLGSMSETLIFVFLGVSAISGPHDWNWIFITSTLFSCLIWRMLGVFLQAFLMNRFRMIPISFKDQFIIGYGGLRGAIAFSLVYLLPSESFVHKPLFITSTIALIFFTVFIQGSTIRPLVGLLDVKRKGEQEPTVSVEIASRFLDLLLVGIEDLCGHFGHHSWRKMYEHCNSKYLKKLLIREETGSGSSIVAMYQRLERRSALEQIEMLRVPSAASDLFLQEGAPAGSEEVLSWHHEREDLQGEEENVHRLLGRSMYKPPRRHPSYSRHSLPHDDLEKQVAEILLRRRRCLRRPIQTIHRQMTLPGNSSNHNRVPRHHSGYTMSIPNSRELAHRCNSTNSERFVSTHRAESRSHDVGNDEVENIGHHLCGHPQDASEHYNAWLLGQVDDITEDNQECLTADSLSWTKSL